jgi:hypothetical protein
MIGSRAAVVRLILGCALILLVPAAASAQVVELPPSEEGFDCRASSVRLAADATDPEATRFEPFIANRDVFPCVDDDTGAPSITQVPGDATPEDPRAVVGAAFARTRDGEPEPPGETPPPAEELGVIRSEAGAANVFLTNGESVIAAVAVRAEASVRCVDGQPEFRSSSTVVGLTVGDPEPALIFPPQTDDPSTPEDETHVHLDEEGEGPVHIGHVTEATDANGVTTHTRRALWLENGDDGDGGEIVVGEASVSVHGNPCTGRITIVKNAVPDNAQDFTFTGLPTAEDSFTLDDDPDTEDQPRSRTFDVVPDQYTVTEAPAPGFRLVNVTCAGDNAPAGGESDTEANVDLAATEDVVCTFINVSDEAICPEGSLPNDDGVCVIQETECPDGSSFVGDQCIVDTVSCPPGSFEGDAQNCVREETVCPPGSDFNAAGQCVVTETQCPPGSQQNAVGQCVSTQVVTEDVPRGGVVVPIDQVPGASVSPCSRPGFGTLVGIVGTNGPDRITGTNRSDRIFAFGGRDRVSGGRGNDCVEGGSGNDNLDGSNGNDFLLGGTGRDIMNGGTGRDRLEGGTGTDKLIGGSGHDRADGGAGRDKMSGGPGNDRLNGGASRDYIEGGQGSDRVNGGSGDDAINVAEAGPRRDFVNCGSGRDTVRIDGEDRVRNCERILVLRSPRRR